MIKKIKELEKFLNIPHDTPYHEESILEHVEMCFKNSNNIFMKLVSLFHDVGKPIVKNNGKYYGHAGVSLYKMFDFIPPEELKRFNINIKDLLYTINFHMLPYEKNKKICLLLPKHIKELIYKFNEIDDISRISKIKNKNKDKFICPEIKININIENNKKVFVMVGVPGSGKSYFIKKYLNEYPIISRDSIIEELMGGEYRFNEVDQDKVNKILEERMREYSKKYNRVVIDMTNTSEKVRRRNLQYFQRFQKQYFVFLVPFNVILERNRNRGLKNISYEIVINFMKKFQLPEYNRTIIFINGEKL